MKTFKSKRLKSFVTLLTVVIALLCVAAVLIINYYSDTANNTLTTEGDDFITFFDVGALVWFARIISWEFPGFAVDTHKEGLWKAQAVLEQKGCITGSTHRFFLVARRPEQK